MCNGMSCLTVALQNVSMEDTKDSLDFMDEVLDSAHSFCDNLKAKISQCSKETLTSRDQLQEANKTHKLLWESLKKTQQDTNDNLEILWKKESELKPNRENLEQEVDVLVSQNKVLEDEIGSCQTCQTQLNSEACKAEQESMAIAKQLLICNPRDKFMDQLLQNITKLKWSVDKRDDGDHLQGTIVSSTKGPQHFDFCLDDTSPTDIRKKLWSLMNERERFEKELSL